MATDRQLSANFWLREFPGWENATEEDVARLRPTVSRVLQPLRSHMGVPVRPTSWKWWSSGVPRKGSHAHGGTVDFVVADGLTPEAFEWGAQHLIPSGYIGRWIYEPERRDSRGRVTQGEHIHMAPVEAMLEQHPERADSTLIQVLEEREEGSYFLHFEVAPVAWGGLAALAGAAVLYFTLAGGRLAPAS